MTLPKSIDDSPEYDPGYDEEYHEQKRREIEEEDDYQRKCEEMIEDFYRQHGYYPNED
jgi:hypothetical protein